MTKIIHNNIINYAYIRDINCMWIMCLDDILWEYNKYLSRALLCNYYLLKKQKKPINLKIYNKIMVLL